MGLSIRSLSSSSQTPAASSQLLTFHSIIGWKSSVRKNKTASCRFEVCCSEIVKLSRVCHTLLLGRLFPDATQNFHAVSQGTPLSLSRDDATPWLHLTSQNMTWSGATVPSLIGCNSPRKKK